MTFSDAFCFVASKRLISKALINGKTNQNSNLLLFQHDGHRNVTDIWQNLEARIFLLVDSYM